MGNISLKFIGKFNQKEKIMKKVITKFFVMSFVLFMMTNVSIGQNVVLNPGFEDGTGDLPDSWSTYIQDGSSEFSWCADTFYTGAKAVCITHADSAASSFKQTIAVQANYKYLVSGYIKTVDVGCGTNWWEGGAQLKIEGDVAGNWWDNMTSRLCGTNDWTYVELQITTTSSASEIEVHCKLGEGMKIRGTAWYDDISLEEVGPLAQYFSNGDFETGCADDPTFPDAWELDINSNDKGTCVLDDAVFHGGAKSGRLTYPINNTGEIIIKQDAGPYPDGLVDGALYKISGWIKTENVTGGRGACFITAYDNHTIANTALHDNTDWTYIEETVVYQETSWGFLRCYLGVDSTTTGSDIAKAWFDDVNVEFIGKPPAKPEEINADYDGSKVTIDWAASEAGSHAIDHYLIRKITQNDTTGNIKKNSGFEEPNDDADFADSWGHWGYGPEANYTWVDIEDEPGAPHSGDFCVSIDHSTGGFGMIYRKVYPPEGEKGCDALLRGFVKTQNVEGGSGAYIAFGYGSGDLPPEGGLYGTNDYTIVENAACIDGGKYVCCLFGTGGDQVIGKAYYDDVTVTPFDSIGKSTTLSFEDSDVVSDTIYYYSVRAVDVTGLYSPSIIIKVDLNSPDAVTLLAPEDGLRTLGTLSWEKVMGASGYFVNIKKSGTTVWSDEVTETSVTIPVEVLEEDSTYTWTVQYIKNSNYYAVSEERSFIYTIWPETYDYISDLTETYWQNGWGDGYKDLSTDGNPILIAGVEYSKGLGMHAPSEVHYPICDYSYDYFMSYIGHDDEANGGNGVIFKVAIDNDTVFTSDAKKWGVAAELIKIDISSGDTLKLIMDDGDDMGYDHADWADPIFYLRSVGIDDQHVLLPTETELVGNFPNPFNPTTQIVFKLHEATKISINIYNVLGQKVATIADGHYSAGKYNISWNGVSNTGSHLSSGVYFYELKTDSYSKVKKMILMQ